MAELKNLGGKREMRFDITRDTLANALEDAPNLEGKDIIIWGAGHTAQLYQEGFSRFEKAHPWFRIAAYCDNNPKKTRGSIWKTCYAIQRIGTLGT